MKAASKILILLITSFHIIPADGQPDERIGMHLDRNRFIAGEDLWFSIFDVNEATGRLSPLSLVVYVELINPWNIPVVQKRIRMTGGRGNGSMIIPDSVTSGTYLVRAYTNRMKPLLPEHCFMNEIDIYNPFKEPGWMRRVNSSDINDKRLPAISPDNTAKAEIITDTVAGLREKVTVKINTGTQGKMIFDQCDLSVSVVQSGLSDTVFRFSDYIPGNKSAFNDAETNGHFLSLRIKNSDGKKTENPVRLFMSVQGKIAEFRYAEMDSSGFYTFLLPPDSRQRTLIFQPEIPEKGMSLELEPSFPWIMPETVSLRDSVKQSELDIFSGLSFNFQASRIYGIDSGTEEEVTDPVSILKRRFYGKPEMEVFLDDYIKLPNMTEVFFELIPGILLRSGREGYEVKITNPLTGSFYDEPPLVMVDGIIINDLNVLVDLNPDLVEKIEVVMTPYLIGDLILHGIVNVITRSGDFSDVNVPEYASILTYRVFEPGSLFISPTYADEKSRSARIPDLRNTLYWNPSVKTDADGIAEIEFWTSDIPGIYTINVRGIKSSGEKISVSAPFVVK